MAFPFSHLKFNMMAGFGTRLITWPNFRDLAAFQTYSQPIVHAFRNPSTLLNRTTDAVSRIRDVNRQQLISAGVVGAEVLGFFTVGEMIGKIKLVGYRGDTEHHETATSH